MSRLAEEPTQKLFNSPSFRPPLIDRENCEYSPVPWTAGMAVVALRINRTSRDHPSTVPYFTFSACYFPRTENSNSIAWSAAHVHSLSSSVKDRYDGRTEIAVNCDRGETECTPENGVADGGAADASLPEKRDASAAPVVDHRHAIAIPSSACRFPFHFFHFNRRYLWFLTCECWNTYSHVSFITEIQLVINVLLHFYHV